MANKWRKSGKIRKVAQQGCILSYCLLNLYTENIMINTSLDESSLNQESLEKYQSFRYADYITLMIENEEELICPLIKEENEGG